MSFLKHFLVQAASSVAAKKVLEFLKGIGHEALDAEAVDVQHGETVYYVYYPKDISEQQIQKFKKDIATKGYRFEKDLGARTPVGKLEKLRAFEIFGPRKSK